MKISVVIPLYNKKSSIRRAVESVLAQSLAVEEIVVVDDGSSDGSCQVVKELIKECFLRNDYRIRLISQTNSGVSAARNAGIHQAKGEWVAFLDADDVWLPFHIESIARLHAAFPQAEVLSTDYQIITTAELAKRIGERKKRIGDSFFSFADSFSPNAERANREGEGFVVKDLYGRLLFGKHVVWSSAAVVKKAALISVGGFDKRMTKGEDIDCWERLYEKTVFAQGNTVTVFYVSDPPDGNATRKAGDVRTYAVYLNKAAFFWKSDKDLYRFKVIYGYLKHFVSLHQWRNMLLLLLRHNVLFLKIPIYILEKHRRGF